MSYMDDEHIVCEFLRKISPSREWEYLGEVEHYWIGELCESIREHECAENAKLREYARKLLTGYECGRGELCEGCSWNGLDGDCNARMRARELGIEVES